MRISIAEYAESIGKTRMTVYSWIKKRQAGKKSKLPANVKVEMIAGHPIINVKGKK